VGVPTAVTYAGSFLNKVARQQATQHKMAALIKMFVKKTSPSVRVEINSRGMEHSFSPPKCATFTRFNKMLLSGLTDHRLLPAFSSLFINS
jgi:hypothetical protein